MSVSSIQGNYLSGLKTGGLNTNRNATNSISPRTTQMPADRVEINGKKKGLSNTQKCGIGLAVAGTLAAAALLMKGKAGAASKLAEHIDFKQATSIDEAIAFARTELGIKKYSKDMPLDVMNWVNEGLVNVNNAAKGKAKMPKNVVYKDLIAKGHEDGCFAAMGYNTLYLNKNLTAIREIFKQYAEIVVKNQEICTRLFGKDVVQLIKQHLEHPEKYSFGDKIKALSAVTQMDTYINCRNLKIARNGNYKIDGFETIYHEMGHLQHRDGAGLINYMQMGKPSECKGGKASRITADFLNSQEKQRTAQSISRYAATSPLEFVAETYQKLVSQALHGGEKLPDDVMKLYAEYKGPAV